MASCRWMHPTSTANTTGDQSACNIRNTHKRTRWWMDSVLRNQAQHGLMHSVHSVQHDSCKAQRTMTSVMANAHPAAWSRTAAHSPVQLKRVIPKIIVELEESDVTAKLSTVIYGMQCSPAHCALAMQDATRCSAALCQIQHSMIANYEGPSEGCRNSQRWTLS